MKAHQTTGIFREFNGVWYQDESRQKEGAAFFFYASRPFLICNLCPSLSSSWEAERSSASDFLISISSHDEEDTSNEPLFFPKEFIVQGCAQILKQITKLTTPSKLLLTRPVAVSLSSSYFGSFAALSCVRDKIKALSASSISPEAMR